MTIFITKDEILKDEKALPKSLVLIVSIFYSNIEVSLSECIHCMSSINPINQEKLSQKVFP